MNSEKLSVTVYVATSLITIGVLVFLLIRCNKKIKDNYCSCTGKEAGRGKFCSPAGKALSDYMEGQTEYAPLAQIQASYRAGGGDSFLNGWTRSSPGEHDWTAPGRVC